MEGVGGNQLLPRVSDLKATLAAALAKISPVKDEVDKAIQRTHALGGGSAGY